MNLENFIEMMQHKYDLFGFDKLNFYNDVERLMCDISNVRKNNQQFSFIYLVCKIQRSSTNSKYWDCIGARFRLKILGQDHSIYCLVSCLFWQTTILYFDPGGMWTQMIH